jgi:5,10-methylenetetrahydromethanopterin reductase
MTQLGIQIIPTMPVNEVIETAVMAEELGYDFCLVADEGFMPDVYVALGAIAQRTQRIQLGLVTNGYTRHPAVTANALATLDDLSGGRAIVVLVAGGSLVLNPMGIPREAPLTVMRESIEIMRRLWSGEQVTWQGKRHSLHGAQLHGAGQHAIPIWMAVRGEKMLELAGRVADGVVLGGKSDVGPALQIMAQGNAECSTRVKRIYMERIAYTPELLAEASALDGYVLLDLPQRILDGLGIGAAQMQALRNALACGDRSAAAQLIPADLFRRNQIAGTVDECRRAVQELVAEHRLDGLVINLTDDTMAANRRYLEDVWSIVQG